MYKNSLSLQKKLNKLKTNLKVVKIEGKYVIVKDAYGLCKVQVHSLLSNSVPSINTALDKTEYFKNKLAGVQPKIKVLGEYKGSFIKIKIETDFGICECFPNRLLGGTQPSITSAINKNNYFINQAREVHGDIYDYFLVTYINANSKIKINCVKHGVFEQTASNHLRGNICKKCSSENQIGTWYKNENNFNKPCEFYILKIEGDEEKFLKYGVSVNLEKRIKSIINESNKKYKVTVLKKITNTVKYCYKLENKFKSIVNKTKHLPKYNFCGKNECFK